MRAAAANLLKILQGVKQFIIPIYQRTYRWELTNCQQFWNDVVAMAQNDSVPSHFIGSIVYVGNGAFQAASIVQLLLIDGQQRLTTLFLLLAALGQALAETGDEAQSKITKQYIRNTYLFNSDEKGEQHYKLLLTQSDRETLIRILEGEDEPDTASAYIKQNYEFFKKQLRQSGIDPLTLYKGISKLTVVDISLEPRDNPQLIFEGLNSTGVALSQADLIRNYVLMGLDSQEQEQLYRSYWYPMEQRFGHAQNDALFNRFMRDYLTIKSKTGEIPTLDRVYAVFKSYQQSNNTVSMRELVADIYHYARHFADIAFAKDKDSEINQLFSALNTLQVYVAYPFLLEVYEDYKQERLVHQDFIAILKLVESYVFRRAICGLPTNSLNKIFATLAREIDREHYLASVEAAFLAKTATGRFPTDEEFRAEFVVKDMYNFRSRNYLLNRLENYRRKERVNIEEYTIEHIMPQNERLSKKWRDELGPDWRTVHAQYLHSIGNLTLTGYNSELSDRPFQDKRDMKDGFKDTPIRLSKGLAKLEHWNAEEIQKRARTLADTALKIWPAPAALLEQSVQIVQTPPQVLQAPMQASEVEHIIHLPEPPVAAGYTLESHLGHMQFDIRGIFERLRKRILNLDASVKEDVRKRSLVYSGTGSFVTIEPQRRKLVLTLNAKLNEIDDAQGTVKALIDSASRASNGDIEIHITALNQIEDTLYLIHQAFERQIEEVYT
ncbi:MAG: DUF262 and DUF1524 domain-containing protein [Chloroflexota bacterium]|nr:DUF262 and DUF1524 domain-containing protein [Chloroflexota bacterium]